MTAIKKIHGAMTGTWMTRAEVTDIQFRYFDGLDRYLDWDSTLEEKLPVAVEIMLAIARSNESQRTGVISNTMQIAGQPGRDDLIYRMVVKLPVMEPPTQLELEEEEERRKLEEIEDAEEIEITKSDSINPLINQPKITYTYKKKDED